MRMVMITSNKSEKSTVFRNIAVRGAAAAMVIATLMTALPAMAHHPFGGQAPKTIFEGFSSGIGHPVIGFDHFAFVIAVGLLAAVLHRGVIVPVTFLLAALVGSGLHLGGFDLPAPEWVISGSVLLFGALVTARRKLSVSVVVVVTALVGLFHGYAYGETVVGAEPTPLVAYLLGFTVIQGAIAGVAYFLSERALNRDRAAGLVSVHHAGFAIFGAGVALLGDLIV